MSKHFEINLNDSDFDRAIPLNDGRCIAVFTCRPCPRSRSGSRSVTVTIENRSDIPFFAKIKIYSLDNVKTPKVSSHSILKTNGATSRASVSSYDYGKGSFLCSVKATLCEKCQSIEDSAEKKDSTPDTEAPIVENRLEDLSLDMGRLLALGELSDVTVSNGTTDIRAHKVVLSARSSVFSKMFQHTMRENHENRVTISDISCEVLKEFLAFTYTGAVTIQNMKMARDLYVAADKYDIKKLRHVCSKLLEKVSVDSVLDTLALADLYEDKILKQSALDFIDVHYSQVKKNEKWSSFMKENQVLAMEVLSFVLEKRT